MVGNVGCFLSELIFVILCKLIITGVVFAAIFAYRNAHKTIKRRLKDAKEAERIEMTTRYEAPKTR